jgi:WD40 repeat protein
MQLGRYALLGEIGRGGMGAVYRARGPDGRDVAVKLLLRPGAGAGLARFERERRLLAALGEPDGFVPLLDVGSSPQGPFLVMPFVAGGTLRARLERGPLPAREAAALLQGLARAAGRAHARGIVHRDLKAENVLFTPDGRPLITDLGLAKHFRHDVAGASQSVAVSKDGAMLGTIGNMAPEQLRDARSVGPPADVFALGTILYECLAGEPPFTGDHPATIISAVFAGEVPPLPADVPPWLAQVVLRCLDAEPAMRFADGEALARALRPPRARAPRRSPLALGVALGALLGGGGVIAVLLASRGPPVAPAPAAAAPPSPSTEPATTSPPGPAPAPPAQAGLGERAQTDGFRDGPVLRLRAVWGSYAGRHMEAVSSVDVSLDGRRAVSAAEDQTVRLWSLPSLEEERTIVLPATASCVALTQDGRQLVAGSADGVVHVFQAETGRQVAAFEAGALVAGVALSGGGSQVLALDIAGRLRRWDLGRAAPSLDVAAHTGRGLDLVWPAGGQPITVGEDGLVRAWSLGRGQTDSVQRLEGEVLTCVSPGPGSLAAVGAAGGAVAVLDVMTGERRWQVAGHEGDLNCVLVDAARGVVYSGGTDRVLRQWDLASGAERGALRWTGWVNGLALLPDGALLVASGDQTVRRWDPTRAAPDPPPTEGHTTRVTQVLALDDATAISASGDQTLRVWSITDGVTRRVLEGHRAWVADAAAAPDGRVLSSDFQGEVRRWDVAGAAAPVALLGPPGAAMLRVCPLPERSAVSLTGAGQGAVLLWELDAGTSRPLREGGQPTEIAVSPDGARVAVGQVNGARYVCRSDDGTLIQQLPSHGFAVTRMQFTPDGKLLISADSAGNLLLTHLGTEDTSDQRVHVGPIVGLAVSRDGARLLTTSIDRQVILLDLVTGRTIDQLDLSSSADHATCAAFTPDGRTVLLGTARGVVLVFDVR